MENFTKKGMKLIRTLNQQFLPTLSYSLCFKAYAVPYFQVLVNVMIICPFYSWIIKYVCAIMMMYISSGFLYI
jgi:hypothetical protein